MRSSFGMLYMFLGETVCIFAFMTWFVTGDPIAFRVLFVAIALTFALPLGIVYEDVKLFRKHYPNRYKSIMSYEIAETAHGRLEKCIRDGFFSYIWMYGRLNNLAFDIQTDKFRDQYETRV